MYSICTNPKGSSTGTSKGPFQPKAFYDSMTILKLNESQKTKLTIKEENQRHESVLKYFFKEICVHVSLIIHEEFTILP